MVELEIHAWPEDQAVSGPAEMEHTDLVALAHALPFVHRNLAGRHFRHSDGHDAHQTYVRVVSLDEDQRPGRHLRDVALRIIGTGKKGLIRRQPFADAVRYVGPGDRIHIYAPEAWLKARFLGISRR